MDSRIEARGVARIGDTSVDKVYGKPRYIYKKNGDFWQRVKAGES